MKLPSCVVQSGVGRLAELFVQRLPGTLKRESHVCQKGKRRDEGFGPACEGFMVTIETKEESAEWVGVGRDRTEPFRCEFFLRRILPGVVVVS